MSKSFREWNVDQVWLLAPSIDDFVPEGHAAHLIREVVRTGLDLSAIDAAYGGERGQPPYHPAMMVALLLYAYSQGIYASRRIAADPRQSFRAPCRVRRTVFAARVSRRSR